ncbi:MULTISPECIES: SDR family NAD(P)-dependent oxidoreductase [unclassified Pseudomonas]|uniref:SDR family NAD(P)-dependent oxidoreductase n=1 Tax=unclassified Pseudomonas TaxID=196821 RepID=UPI0039B75B99
MDIQDKAAVVTGGASGIGRGIALALACAGADVVVADIDAVGAGKVVAEIRALGRQAELFVYNAAKEGAARELADFAFGVFPHTALIFNNAGVVISGMALDTSFKDLQWLFSVNAFGVWNGSMEFASRFIKQGIKGWICNTSSENGLAAASIGTAAYTASKHAVMGMTEAFRDEFQGQIGFSVVCPGIVKTGMWDAGRNRPDEFGGKFSGNPINAKAMSYGLDAEEAGRLIVAAVRNEEFFILTHRHVVDVAHKRWTEIESATERQFPDAADDHTLSTIEIQQRVMREYQSKS